MGFILLSDWACAISISLFLTTSGFYNGCSDMQSRSTRANAKYEIVHASEIKVPEMKFNYVRPSAEEAFRRAMNISDTIISVKVTELPDISEYDLPE